MQLEYNGGGKASIMSKQKIRWDVENLKESPEFLRGLLESLNSAILLVDKDRQVRSFNAFFSKIF
jgi:PAS domain-containing protein